MRRAPRPAPAQIVAGHVSPSTFATIAASSNMTRTIRMALAGNAVKGVDIAPPFEDKPDRVPLGPHDEQNVVDPVGAFVFPAPASGPIVSPAACNRKIPIFDGYTRFDIDLTYVGERSVKAKGYDGPVVVCAFRYVPISGHRRDRPATKFMADNKDLEVWLAPIESDHILFPFRVSARTMIGTTVIEASEFRVERSRVCISRILGGNAPWTGSAERIIQRRCPGNFARRDQAAASSAPPAISFHFRHGRSGAASSNRF